MVHSNDDICPPSETHLVPAPVAAFNVGHVVLENLLEGVGEVLPQRAVQLGAPHPAHQRGRVVRVVAHHVHLAT